MDSELDAQVAAELLVFAEQTTEFVGVSDPWGRVLYLNPAARKRLGVGDATDLTLADVFPADAFTLYYDVVRPQLLRTGAWSGEVPVNIADGSAVRMYVSASARIGPGGETNGTVVFAHDLPRVEPAAAPGESEVDEVTGLLTASAFDEEARSALAAASRDGEICALVLVSIDIGSDTIAPFDLLTVTTVLRALGGRLTRGARSVDTAGHVGEHTFGLVLRGVRSRSEALRIARTVYESLVDTPVTTPSGEMAGFVGCGVALSTPGDDLVDLIQRASVTIWHDAANDGAEIDTASPITVARDASGTMDEFRIAMSHGDVRAYARPVVDLASGRVVGYCGLARWHHRRLGTLDSATFIDMIAETTLANQVDLHVARETAAVLALTTRDTPLRLYVPASRRLIEDVRTEQYLSEIADAFSLKIDQMRLRLARSLLNNWNAGLDDALNCLRDADVALVLTGVEGASDIEHLARYEFRELHLSSRLTDAAASDSKAALALSEIVELAHDGGVLVVATGVNDQQQRDVVIETGCDLATGDLYGKPQPADTID